MAALFLSRDCLASSSRHAVFFMEYPYQSWHLCWEYPPNTVGGLGVACSGLVSTLEEKSSTRVFSADLLSGGSSYDCYEDMGLYEDSSDFDQLVESFKPPSLHVLKDFPLDQLSQFTESILQCEPDDGVIVHGHDWHSILAAVALKKFYGTPFILHVHSTQVERVGSHSRNWISDLEQWGILNADRVICVSEISKQSLINNYRVLESKLHVCHNALIHSSECRPPSSEVRTLLFAGRMCSQKSPELMVEVMRNLSTKYPHLHLIMAGEGEQAQELRSMIEMCELTSKIQLLGKVPHKEMLSLYDRTDVLCLPSVAEPFGLVALEAASRGLSVVLSDRCGAAEILTLAKVVSHRDVEGWVASIVELIENPGYRAANTLSVQKEAASRTWQDAATEILAIYASLKN